jgi:hypothetical protein
MSYQIYILEHRFQIMKCHDFKEHDDVSALEKGIAFSARDPVEGRQIKRLVACIGLDGEATPNKHFDSSARGPTYAA